MNKLPIYNYLDLSTAHITQETDEYLSKQEKIKLIKLLFMKKIVDILYMFLNWMKLMIMTCQTT